jgi:hypothetical protein
MNGILRDVLAGCAGVAAVAAMIGMPRGSAAVQPQQLQVQHAVLLPYFTRVAPAVPAAPHQRIIPGP